MRLEVPPLYGIADDVALGSMPLGDAVARLSEAGLSWIQVRAKRLSDRELWPQVEVALRGLAPGVVLWINDRVDLARCFDLPVHLGQSDLEPRDARALLGSSTLIGRSTHDLEQVAEADRDPDVDVVAFGPIFPTRSKRDADPVVGLATLAAARKATQKPLLGIGGIDAARLEDVYSAGADTAVVLGALGSGPEIAVRAAALAERARQVAARPGGEAR